MKRAAKQVLIVLLIVMAVIGTGNISAQADYNWKPKKVSIAQSAKKVSQGKEFEIRAKVTPIDAEDDYIRWEIISGKKYVKFEDREIRFVNSFQMNHHICCYFFLLDEHFAKSLH